MDPRLLKLIGGDELAALRRRLRRHFERAAPGTPPSLLRLGSLSTTEREALALLTGRPPREAKSMQIDVTLLNATLRDAGIAGSLREALEQIDGPIVHPASVRAATQARWSAVVASCTHPALTGFLQAPAALGLLKRLARQDTSAAEHLLEAADAVLSRLPAGGLARAQLAAETLGDAHALDNGQVTATLVLAAWRQIEKGQLDASDPEDTPDERTRDVWARAGVLVNELARPALLLNLPVRADEAPVCTPGEPAYVSLRRLLRTPPRWAVAGQAVFVCENPNLVAIAADRLGVRCAALVCTDGMPAAAQRTLLTQLAQAGARLRYHGDFDWPGVQIANHVMCTWGAHPWRFGALDYEAATASASHTRRDLADAYIIASWDAALAPAMQRHGLAIAEEAVAAPLLGDLRQD
ncbi:TIGR02679 family protein [Variovorax sp. LjRoot84]|uniref:TIGR02679 family protein n=1 Tax=Variovorax sp. LjRoot84 TaxID=3342340 RepID=UPI003ECD3E38